MHVPKSTPRCKFTKQRMKFWAKEICFMVISWLNWCIFEEIPVDVFIDGHPVAHEHFPFIVSLQEWTVRWKHICVGNIVDQKNVLTACQCVGSVHNNSVQPKDATKLRVYAGAGDMDFGSAVEQYIKVRNFTAHPRVSSEANGSTAFDLALLHLSRDLEFNFETLPMNLPASDTTVHSKALCYSPGWGRRWGEHHLTQNLTLVECRRIPTSQCTNMLCKLFAMCSKDLKKHQQTCAINSKLTSCFTELGSPLVCHGFVYGMATFKAGPNSPIIFTGLKPILEMVQGIKKGPQTQKPMKKGEKEDERASRAVEDRRRIEDWVRMLSSSQVHRATKIMLALECLLALTA